MNNLQQFIDSGNESIFSQLFNYVIQQTMNLITNFKFFCERLSTVKKELEPFLASALSQCESLNSKTTSINSQINIEIFVEISNIIVYQAIFNNNNIQHIQHEILQLLNNFRIINDETQKIFGICDENHKSQYQKIIFNNGDTQIGNYNEIGMNGICQQSLVNGESYFGEFKDNLLNGVGQCKLENGDEFTGMFKSNLRCGYGVQKYSNGDVYIGEWKDDKRNGWGQYTYANGECYQGQFQNDLKCGEGQFKWASGILYKGNYVDDLICGDGYFNSIDSNWCQERENTEILISNKQLDQEYLLNKITENVMNVQDKQIVQQRDSKLLLQKTQNQLSLQSLMSAIQSQNSLSRTKLIDNPVDVQCIDKVNLIMQQFEDKINQFQVIKDIHSSYFDDLQNQILVSKKDELINNIEIFLEICDFIILNLLFQNKDFIQMQNQIEYFKNKFEKISDNYDAMTTFGIANNELMYQKRISNDGEIQIGLFNNNGMCGICALFQKDSQFLGRFDNQCKNGVGFFYNPDANNCYIGEYVDNYKSFGKYVDAQKNIYIGCFSDDENQFNGVTKRINGEFFEGDMKYDCYEGHGKLTYPNGDIYTGEFSCGHRDTGVLTTKDGNIFDGSWSGTQFCGKASLTYPNGDTYEGGWENGKRIGAGKLTIKLSGSILDGQWDNDDISCSNLKQCLEFTDHQLFLASDVIKSSEQIVDSFKNHLQNVEKVKDQFATEMKEDTNNEREINQADYIDICNLIIHNMIFYKKDAKYFQEEVQYLRGQYSSSELQCNSFNGDQQSAQVLGVIDAERPKYQKRVFQDNEIQIGQFDCESGDLCGICQISSPTFQFIGEFLNGKPNGIGKFINEDEEYIGEYYNGQKLGCGFVKQKQNWQNISEYCGQFQFDSMIGFGRSKRVNGNVIVGGVHWGTYQKQKGKLICVNDDIFYGDLENGVKQGFGKLVKSNGDICEGEWDSDQFKDGCNGAEVLQDEEIESKKIQLSCSIDETKMFLNNIYAFTEKVKSIKVNLSEYLKQVMKQVEKKSASQENRIDQNTFLELQDVIIINMVRENRSEQEIKEQLSLQLDNCEFFEREYNSTQAKAFGLRNSSTNYQKVVLSEIVGALSDMGLEGLCLKVQDGDKWFIEYHNDVQCGKGKHWHNDVMYLGELKNDWKEGCGLLTCAAYTYEGQFKSNEFCGTGILQLPNGSKYEGYFESNKFSGFGSFKTENYSYVGEWWDNKYHGQGIYKGVDGSTLQGRWQNGFFVGKGKFCLPDWPSEGGTCDGEWHVEREDDFDTLKGEGTITRANSTYRGLIVNGRRHGLGNFECFSFRYEGEWNLNIMSNQGQLVFTNGDAFVGQWKYDWDAMRLQGEGEVKYSNGDAYSGSWSAVLDLDDEWFRNGLVLLKYGQGRLVRVGGEVVEGVWRNDEIEIKQGK